MIFQSRAIAKLPYVLTDLAALFVSLFLALTARHQSLPDPAFFFRHIPSFSIVFLLWLVILYGHRLYDETLMRDKITLYSSLIRASVINVLIAIGFFYLLPSLQLPFSTVQPRTNLIGTALIGAVLLALLRLFYARYMSAKWHKIKIGLWALNDKERQIMDAFARNHKEISFNVLDSKSTPKKIARLKIILVGSGKPADSTEHPFLVVHRSRIVHVSKFLEEWSRAVPLEITDYRDFATNHTGTANQAHELAKRAIDSIISLIILIILFPLVPLIALLIKLEDRGPVLYTQKRIGKAGRKFIMYKFRSMIPQAASTARQSNFWTKREDPRVTHIGKMLRVTHLDEYPQLFNILKGDMSLVGPRPERPEIVTILKDKSEFYKLRHLVKPGLTGWAQVHYQYADSVKTSLKKLEFDLYYIKHRSFLFDLAILIKTLGIFLGGGGR